MSVWSVSPYFGEYDIASIKLQEQREVVDRFVLLEADRDHQGKLRQYSWFEIAADMPDVRYGQVDLPRGEPWELEGQHRAALQSLMPELQDTDLVIISDLDEILSDSYIARATWGEWLLPAQIAFPIYPYRLDWRWTRPVEIGWCRCTIATGAQVRKRGTDGVIKGGKASKVVASDAGWHFTYQGTAEQIALKAASVADTWTAKATVEDARRSIETGVDLFGRDRPVEPVPLDELPRYVQQNQERFAHLLRGGSDGNDEEGEQDRPEEAPDGVGEGSRSRAGER